MRLMKDPETGLLLPSEFIEDKTSLKMNINKVVEDAVNSVKLKENYFLTLHAKFDEKETDKFLISQMVASLKIPPFTSNQLVFFVSPKSGLIELLWMVAAKVKGQNLKVEFNKKGIAYLQAKGAMPS